VRLLFVVQRYGTEVLGGSEAMTLAYSTRLAAQGHEVHVLTSCATSYVDWANSYAPGTYLFEGVHLHRLPVLRRRVHTSFAGLSGRVLTHPQRIPLYLQKEWMRQQGPLLPELEPWLVRRSGEFDAVLFITYLYYTTWAGLAACRAPSILFSTAHDEPPLALPLFDGVFALPTAFGFLTEEEGALVRRRFGTTQPSSVVGVGIEPRPGPIDEFRQRFGVGARPYIAYAGRIDPSKGAFELLEMFCRYKRRRPGPLALVMIGEAVAPVAKHPDVITTGFVDAPTKDAGLGGAQLLAQPSYFESFSMVLAEAWALGTPAIVQGHCDVLAGQAKRSGGGIPYRGYPEFEAALDLLLDNNDLRMRLAASGRRYVLEQYTWDAVLGRLRDLIEEARRQQTSIVAADPSAGHHMAIPD
jgi:glycosyltransferase involved in cell wall biosynthesis